MACRGPLRFGGIRGICVLVLTNGVFNDVANWLSIGVSNGVGVNRY